MKRQHVDPEDILLSLDWTEDDDLEFKSGKGGVPHSLWETYSAMVNTHGGVILLGVEDDGSVSGVEHPDRVKKSLWDLLHNRNKVNTNLLTDGDVAEVSHSDGTIVAIRVPRASREQRPVFVGLNPLTGEVDNSRVRQICNIHAVDVTRLLQALVSKAALVRDGHGRWSRYRLVHTNDSEHNGDSSIHKEISSEHKPDHSLHNDADSLHNKELLAIAEPARTQQRLKPADMERHLLALCEGRWLTRHELSLFVERNSESLRQRFLNPMVTHGLLRLRYPDKPNRADQAYTATSLVKETAVPLTKSKAK